jgi:hypothetical protein
METTEETMTEATRQELIRQIEARSAECNTLRQRLQSMSDEVRQIARELCREQNWCAAGEREYLGRLGLKPLSREKAGTVTIRIEEVRITIEDDQNQAEVLRHVLDDLLSLDSDCGEYMVLDDNLVWDEE